MMNNKNNQPGIDINFYSLISISVNALIVSFS